MNKLMVAMLALALPLSSMAAGTAACTGGVAQNNGVVTGVAANFIRNDVQVKCSANVNLNYQQSAVGVGVGSNSLKGKKSFNGSSFGGAVSAAGDCTGGICTAAMAETALQAIPNIGSL